MKRAISNDQRTASRGERSLARVPLVFHRALSTLKAVGSMGSALALLAASATVGVLSCRPVVSDRPAEVAQQATSSTNVAARHDYAVVAQMLDGFIAHEMADKDLSALSIALVDDQQTVWAQGFGRANPSNKTRATAQTVYRVGSVSKLFTDIAIMQLVEQGRLDLDAPVTRYLPDFQPHNPYGKSITLRQLMSHRSGLTREPPVGHCFDPTEPSLAQAIASLNRTELIYAPGSRVKYSDAAIAVAGYILEGTQNEPFAKYLGHAVLEPLDMRHSSFEPTPAVVGNLARAYMWTLDGRVFEAPTFQRQEDLRRRSGSRLTPQPWRCGRSHSLRPENGKTGADGRYL